MEPSDELMFMGIDELAIFQHAVKEKEWNEFMNCAIEGTKKNNTWH